MVAPKGAVSAFDRAQRLQGCSTIELFIISWSVEFGAGSQQLLRRPITVLVLISQAKDLCLQLPVRSSLESAQFMLRNHSDLKGRQAALSVKQLDQHVQGKLTFSLR